MRGDCEVALDSARLQQWVLRSRTSVEQPLSGRRSSHEKTSRGHVRPDKVGRERPPSERVRDRLRGVAAGVAHAPHQPSSLNRAASEAAKTAALIISTGGLEAAVLQ
jgi:hypothetical protein